MAGLEFVNEKAEKTVSEGGLSHLDAMPQTKSPIQALERLSRARRRLQKL